MKKTTIIITDKNDINCGKEYPGHLIYYDVYHRGGTNQTIEHLYILDINGKEHNYVSSQIDEEHYNAQLLEHEIERLGAKVGDKVRITKTGSGSYGKDYFEREQEYGYHTITDISYNGYVTFDNGEADMFRPEVELVESCLISEE